jgi:hypothetical protein
MKVGGILLFGLGVVLLIVGLFSTYMIVLMSIREQVIDVLWYLVFSLPVIFLGVVSINSSTKN